MIAVKACEKCAGNAEGLVPLWDGHVYCRPCIETASPGLADFASDHPTFEDAIPFDRRNALRQLYTMMAFLGFGLTTVAAVLVAGSGFSTAGILGAIFGLPSMVGIIFVASMSQLNASPKRLPRVRIGAGHVTVHRQDIAGGRFPAIQFSLAECTWHLGWLREDSAAVGKNGVIMPREPAIILKAPTKVAGYMHPSAKTATGSTADLREKLAGFLRLAGIAEGR